MTWSIYKITSSLTRKVYVGQTVKSLARRWRLHLNDARAGTGHCTKLVRAIRRYGAESFRIDLIATASSQSEADALERVWIATLNTIDDGLNLRDGGSHGALSDETRKKMSAAHRGKIISDETRAKISAALTGRKNGPPSQATRAEISASHLGTRHSASARSAMSNAHVGKKLSPAHRAAQSAGKRRMWAEMTVEERQARGANISAAKLARRRA